MHEPSPARRQSTLGLVALVFFFGIHLASLSAFATGVTWTDVALCVGLYYLRMFGITAGYHRYFAHRSYRTSRVFQFVLAALGSMSLQKGVLWWAGWHRVHHRYSDTARDLHSPKQRGFWYAHVGWILTPEHDGTDYARIPDFAKFPELRWLDRYHWVPSLFAAAACIAIDGFRGLVWGMGVGTVLLWHGTFTINSLAHLWGSRRYETTDTSRNNFFLALITMGEGWHNNHHHYMNSVNQGFFWWEIDMSYYVLRALSLVGVVRDLRKPPVHVLQPRLARAAEVAGMKLAGARLVAETKIAEAKLAAEVTLAGARLAAETKIAEAREAVGEAAQAAETRITEAKFAAEMKIAEAKLAAETRLTEAREAVEEAAQAASDAVEEVAAPTPRTTT